MNRAFLLLLLLVVFLQNLPAVKASEISNDATYSLPKETSSRFLPNPIFADNGMETHCYAGRSRHVSEFYLLAPLNEEKRFIAIVERTAAPEQKYLLNPPGFNYGHLPALNKLKEDQANIIFGNSIGKNNRYKLIAKDKETFVLDLFFEKGELKKYRIAQVDLKTLDQLSDENLTSWQLVQK